MAGKRRRAANGGDEEDEESKVLKRMDEMEKKLNEEMTKKFDERIDELEDKFDEEMTKKFDEQMVKLRDELRGANEKKITVKEFAMRHIFKNVLEMEEGTFLYQPCEEHFGRQWYIGIARKQNYLNVLLGVNHPTVQGEWKIEMFFELLIVAEKITKSGKTFTILSSESNCYWWPSVSWDEMERLYLNYNELVVLARVTIFKTTGIVKAKAFNFDESNKEHSDVVLKVGNEKFYVLKGFLTRHSQYFTDFFSRNFKNGQPGNKEIELPETDAQDFQNFLEVLHGDAQLDDYTIEGILILNHTFKVKNVLRDCEEFLMEKSKKTLGTKLELASRYDLNALADKCVDHINPDAYMWLAENGILEKVNLYVSKALNKKAATFLRV